MLFVPHTTQLGEAREKIIRITYGLDIKMFVLLRQNGDVRRSKV